MSEPGTTTSQSAPGAAEISGAPRSTVFPAVWFLILGETAAILIFFYRRGLSNLYGDGIAHVEGARRIFDSLTPGYPEIGSVWLPLYHLLAAPLARSDFLWRTGLAGSLVSAAAFALTAWFVFLLSHETNRSSFAGTLALLAFLLCPNMAYLASCPLTEPLAQLWMVLVVFCLFRYAETGRARSLVGAAVAAFCGTLTRYDGWYLVPFAALFVLLVNRPTWRRGVRHAALFAALAAAGPFLWVLHNDYRFGNPIEFYNGPFSARAIYAHQLATTAFPYPTDGSLGLAARYYLEDLKLVIGPWPLALSALGLVAWVADRSTRARRSVALLLFVPAPFYVHSMAYAAVPMYVPTLFPNTYYNLRYGLEMLPAMAVLSSFVFGVKLSTHARALLFAVFLALLTGQAGAALSAGAENLPTVREAILNTPCRSSASQAVIGFLAPRYDGGTVLAAAGKWPCVMPKVGIPFRKVLSETNREYWSKLRVGPEAWVVWILRRDGDPVDQLMRAYPQAFQEFQLVEHKSFAGEGSVAIYRRVQESPPAPSSSRASNH